ncbi:MAG TPA: hypothetical protein VKT81_15280 [Bryobacteraceae bacterium]|nr:hypothetical protein [Bryobacteraceae bacterium]
MFRKICLILGGAAALTLAQDPPADEHVRTRQLWDTTLLEKRPSAAKAPVKRPAASSVKGALVGVTVWRLRPSKAGEESAQRALIQEEASGQAWTPERVAADSPLAEGQKVRVSAESAQDGYLYIIDRDEYADGTKGAPYLIFPTLRTRGGDNRVGPGMVIEIPAQDDNPPYFKVERSRPDQVNEVLTLLITPKPMDELKIERGRIKLTDSQVAGWEKQWRAKSYRLEDVAHEGKPYTTTEKLAARGEKRLNDKDPLPQTMYRVDCKPDSPVMLDVQLKIAK